LLVHLLLLCCCNVLHGFSTARIKLNIQRLLAASAMPRLWTYRVGATGLGNKVAVPHRLAQPFHDFLSLPHREEAAAARAEARAALDAVRTSNTALSASLDSLTAALRSVRGDLDAAAQAGAARGDREAAGAIELRSELTALRSAIGG
jgi:hypothetical protein